MSEDQVSVTLNDLNKVIIHRFGATVISWLHQGQEVLFVSSQAVFDNKKAIRGGIPVVFPNFGPWELGPQHGFARISMWNLDSQEDGKAVFTLVNSQATEKMWPFQFKLTYTVSLSASDGLNCQLDVLNTDNKAFDFTTLLHTYIRLNSVDSTSVTNLHGLKYTDKLRGGEDFTEDRDLVSVVGGADRVYKSTPDTHVVEDNSSGLKVLVTKSNFPDTVVWNPWIEGAKKMADFGDEEYKNMICVEPGSVAEKAVIQPGQLKSFIQQIHVLSSAKL